jgi:hypothetical protein
MTRSQKSDDEFSPEETKRRFEAALRGARIAGSKPMAGPAKKPARRKRRRIVKSAKAD